MCDQLKNCDWQLFSLFAEDQAEADFQHTRGIYAIYGPNLDLIFFLLLVLVAESDLEKGSNFCHRFLLTSIIYQNKHTDWSCRKCKFKNVSTVYYTQCLKIYQIVLFCKIIFREFGMLPYDFMKRINYNSNHETFDNHCFVCKET